MYTLKMAAGQSHFCFHNRELHEDRVRSSLRYYGIPVLAHVGCSIYITEMDTITPHATVLK